jgi:hypothetical protein
VAASEIEALKSAALKQLRAYRLDQKRRAMEMRLLGHETGASKRVVQVKRWKSCMFAFALGLQIRASRNEDVGRRISMGGAYLRGPLTGRGVDAACAAH